MKAHKAALAEVPCGHLSPAVVIGIANDKAGKEEKEVYGKIAVVDVLLFAVRTVDLEDVEKYPIIDATPRKPSRIS